MTNWPQGGLLKRSAIKPVIVTSTKLRISETWVNDQNRISALFVPAGRDSSVEMRQASGVRMNTLPMHDPQNRSLEATVGELPTRSDLRSRNGPVQPVARWVTLCSSRWIGPGKLRSGWIALTRRHPA